MTDESTSSRALIAAYKACARPSAATEAQLWATLVAADRRETAGARRPAPRRTPWLALAAGLVLLAAWALAQPLLSGHVLKDRGQQAAQDARTRSPEAAMVRGQGETETREPEATTGEQGQPEAIGAPQRGSGGSRGAARQAADDAGFEATPAAPRGPTAAVKARSPEPAPGRVEDDNDPVLAEMALLQRAQAALRGGRPGEALELLAQHAEAFAGGSMAEERQALRVLALCASGERAKGSAEKAAFLRAHARSTYTPRVAAACTQDPNDMPKKP